jgi:hypothetical protein
MPGDFTAMDAGLTYELIVRLRDAPPASPDTYNVEWCIVNSTESTVLAGASATYADRFEGPVTVTTNADQTIGPSTFDYVDITASIAAWDNALIEFRFDTAVRVGSRDRNAIQADYFEITGTYTGTPPIVAGQSAAVIDENPVYFINSDDSRLIIRSDPPEANVDLGSNHARSPGTGSVAITEQTPSRAFGLLITGYAPDVLEGTVGVAEPDTRALNFSSVKPISSNEGLREPATATLTIDEKNAGVAYEREPAKDALSFSSDEPIVKQAPTPTIATATLTIAEQSVVRAFGLIIESSAPSLTFGVLTTPTTRALSFSGQDLTISHIEAGDEAPLVGIGSAAISTSTGDTIQAHVIEPDTVALSFSEQTPNTDPVAYMLTGSLDILEFRPDTVIDDGAPVIIIEPGPERGTSIENLTAGPDTLHRYNVCDRSGFKTRPNALVATWDGYKVRPDSWEQKHDQLEVRVQQETHRGALRPSDDGRESFIEDLYPDGIDPVNDGLRLCSGLELADQSIVLSTNPPPPIIENRVTVFSIHYFFLVCIFWGS